MDCLPTTDKQHAPDRFCHRNNIFFNLRETDNLLSPDNGLKTCPQRTSSCTKINSLQEQTEIKASGGKCNISIKILTDSYSTAHRKYIRSFVLSIFIHLVCPHEVADSDSLQTTPLIATLQQECG